MAGPHAHIPRIMSFEAKDKFHRKAQLDRVPRARYTGSIASSRQTKFGIIGSLNTAAPVKLAERQTKARHVSKTVFKRSASSEDRRSLENRVACDRDLIWDEQVAPERQSSYSPSSFGGSSMRSEVSVDQLSLDVGIFDKQSQETTTHWFDGGGGGAERENGQDMLSGHVDEPRGTEHKEKMPINDRDGGRVLSDGHSCGSLISSASSYSDIDSHRRDHQKMMEPGESQESPQLTMPESVHTSSLPLVNQEHDSEQKALLQDQGDSCDDVSSLVFVETASVSGTEPELQDGHVGVEAEKDREKGKKRNDAPTSSSSSPTVRQPSGDSTTSKRSDLAVSGKYNHYSLQTLNKSLS